jgi:succinate-semialdehyde dehydrogenase/glutarate-semialdehyde dehydrogenase
VTQHAGLVDFNRLQLYIDGNWVDAQDDRKTKIINPYTGQPIGEIPNAGALETSQAIAAAERAFEGWSKRTAKERAGYLHKLYDLMIEYKEELARIMALEMGKPVTEGQGEVMYAAGFLQWFAEEGRRIYGETIPAPVSNKRLMVIQQPVGVVACITPWNFPLAMLTRKLGPALAAGCTGIVKPATQSAASALAFAKLVEMAGIPAGVVNVVTGQSGPITDEIFNNPVVKKISFTGSTEVGKLLVQKSAGQLKRLSLELGGNAPFIVFEDADLEAAATGAIASKFRNAGQTCICANRIYVQRSVYDQFIELFLKKVQALKVGDSLDASVQIGPLVNAKSLEKVQEHVDDAVSKGATILCGGSKHPGGPEQGWLYMPTVLGNVNSDMLIVREETFGPIAPIIPFDTEEEVIQKANDTEYGLAAYCYTQDLKRSIRVTEALQFGIVGLNDAVPSTPEAPFGGIKESGMGREGGHQGLREYLNEKFISIGM